MLGQSCSSFSQGHRKMSTREKKKGGQRGGRDSKGGKDMKWGKKKKEGVENEFDFSSLKIGGAIRKLSLSPQPCSGKDLSQDLLDLLSNDKKCSSSIRPVSELEIIKTIGEQLTGGRSTPVYQLTAKFEDGETRSFIAKIVCLSEEMEPQKKEMLQKSYQVEYNFYNFLNVSSSTPSSSAIQQQQFDPSFTDLHDVLVVPRMLFFEKNRSQTVFMFLLTDLREEAPFHPKFLMSNQVLIALNWLADFHAFFWETKGPEGLWPLGSFFSGDKRPIGIKEKVNLKDNWMKSMKLIQKKSKGMFENPGIRSLASRLENCWVVIFDLMAGKLNSKNKKDPRFRTIIHGDFKAANMFLAENTTTSLTRKKKKEGKKSGVGNSFGGSDEEFAAVCDFQFTGEGYGAVDVMYLLYPDAFGNYFEDEDKILLYYFDRLSLSLDRFSKYLGTFSLETLRFHYNLAFVQFFISHLAWSGWVACENHDLLIINRVDSILTQFDQGKVVEESSYRSIISQALAGVSS